MTTQMKCEKTRQLLDQGAYLIDVRSADEYQAGALNGAINLPLQLLSGIYPLIKEDKDLVVYCGTGLRSQQAKTFLQQMGFNKVHDLGSYQNIQAC